MLTIFRRHLKVCPHRSRSWRRCKCPIHIEGSLAGQKVRRSLDLTSWEAATDRLRQWERQGTFYSIQPITIEKAVDLFLEDAKARNLKPETLSKYKVLLQKQLLPFCSERLQFLPDVDIELLREFRRTLKDSPISAQKKVEHLRSFFRFCQESQWIHENPARRLKIPNVDQCPTLPFTESEIQSILDACASYPKRNSFGYDNCSRVKAFVLLLLYTGLRIRDVACDVACLEASRIANGKLLIYTQKTGVPVFLPLPPIVVDALNLLPGGIDRFFWSGNGNPKSCVADWQRTLRRLFKIAGIENGHAHRFRDSFSCRLLERGVPLKDVSILLGHRSERVTEKHYAPWVRSRQERLEELVRLTW